MLTELYDSKELTTILDFIRWGSTQFSKAELVYGHGTDTAWDESVALVLGTLRLVECESTDLLHATLTPTERKTIAGLIQKRIEERIPVPYLCNTAWFGGLSFYVDQRVLIPRSPLAELIQEGFRPWIDPDLVENVLDLCTGSGSIAICCALEFGNAQVDAADLSLDALQVAERNVSDYGLEDRLELLQGDLFEAVPEGNTYDIIISNPPYVSEEQYNALPPEYLHEPKKALLANEQGMAIVRRILEKADQYLNPKGILVVEVGIAQETIEMAYPDIPFTWLQFEEGGEGVFLLTYEELKEFKSHWLTTH